MSANFTDTQWDYADKIAEALEAEPHRLFNRSQLARKCGLARMTGEFVQVINFMERQSMMTGIGNGAWRKYRARKFGEYFS